MFSQPPGGQGLDFQPVLNATILLSTFASLKFEFLVLGTFLSYYLVFTLLQVKDQTKEGESIQ